MVWFYSFKFDIVRLIYSLVGRKYNAMKRIIKIYSKKLINTIAGRIKKDVNKW